ncbi:MAG: hypothetical protein POELPBGB_02549 [Bacteroidia bacterium]|nr:hypothetical protein [Bacteroidia bacterium]
MKKEEREYIHFLEDILLSMQRIQEYIAGLDFQQFKQDYKTVDAVIRNFEIIGEASKNISTEVKLKYSNLPWEEMYRLRNRVSHEYFGVDYEIIWDIATNYLPQNKSEIEEIIRQEKNKL